MNTPAFTNLLGVRVRTRRLLPVTRTSIPIEGVVMAISYGDYRVDVAFGGQVHDDRAGYVARGFVALLLTDDKELHTVLLDAVEPPALVLE